MQSNCVVLSQVERSSAAFLKDDEKKDWLVEPHCFTFGLTFMLAPMRNAALGRIGHQKKSKKLIIPVSANYR